MKHRVVKLIISLSLSSVFLLGCSEYSDRMDEGDKAFEEENYEQAIEAYSSALEEKPEDDEAQRQLNRAEYEKDKIQEKKRIAKEREEERKRKEAEKESVILNVYEVADKEKSTVEKILGEGEKVSDNTFDNTFYTNESAETYSYVDGLVEIYYIENQAARITLNPQEDIPFNDEEKRENFLRKYGFPFWSSSSETDMAILWENVGSISGGLHEMTMFNDGEGNIDYIYIITKEKYE